MRATPTAVLVLGAMVVAGCGGDDSSGPTTGVPASIAAPAPPTTPAVETTTTRTAEAAAPAEPQKTTAPAPPAATTDCDALGINRAKQREGACTKGALEVYVANRGTTVDLDELRVRLNGVGLQPAGSSRTYANASVTVTNDLDQPVAFDPKGDQTVLALGSDRYTEDLSVDSAPGISRPWRTTVLRPGASETVTIVYTIPKRSAQQLAGLGSIVVTQFSDSGRATPRKRIAILRTYH